MRLIHLSIRSEGCRKIDRPAAADEMDTMEAYRKVIKENIEYDIMRQQLGYNADLLDDILDIIVDTVCVPSA